MFFGGVLSERTKKIARVVTIETIEQLVFAQKDTVPETETVNCQLKKRAKRKYFDNRKVDRTGMACSLA
jgi:hypothetical protein